MAKGEREELKPVPPKAGRISGPAGPKHKDRTFYNKSLERALSILCTFSFEGQEFSLKDFSRIQSLPKSTAFRLVSTLVDFGFLKYDNASSRYSLGLRILELGNICQNSLSLRKVALPFISKLQASLGKTVFIGVLWNDELVYIERKDDPGDTIKFGSEMGRARPAYFGMLGQLLMAFLPEDEVDRILTKTPLTPLTKRSITRIDDFKAKLRKIATQGYSFDKDEAFDGISGIAAPIRDAAGKVIAAVGVGFISSAEDAQGVKRIVKEACDAATLISMALGYNASSQERAG